MTISQDIKGLIDRALEAELIEPRDKNYCLNRILKLLKLDSFPDNVSAAGTDTISELLDKIVDHAVQDHVIQETFDDKEILAAEIMDTFIARPSVISHTFYENYRKSPKTATDYFYHLSKNSNYIQMARIQKNVHFKTNTDYGELDITINLSKPEKDPEQIKRERAMKQTVKYPQCLLCAENEGYAGRTGHPARANHRIIPIELSDETWYLQYSPYVYYNEHCILLAEEHRDMQISKDSFKRLLTFVEKFPHYFIGSNADLPIVGGSILTHDHYQGGHYAFAMEKAEKVSSFTLNGFHHVDASILKWPLSVIRLTSHDSDHLVHCADHILKNWRSYSDMDAAICAFTDRTPHNTITPIVRMRDGKYELDLVLRNNRTTTEHPLGIFHPHGDVHHIKKENIGLIEVMGLAVLPARLLNELKEIKQYLMGQTNHVEEHHHDWAEQLKQSYGELSDLNEAETIMQKELGKKFTRVLEDAGVFKQTDSGIAAFERFIDSLN